MAKKVFAMYPAKEGNPNSDAYAKLDLPASPWELWDALEKVRLQTDDILYMEIEDYTSVSSGTGRKFSHNSSKLSRLPRPEDFSGVRISFHSTIESQILQVRNDCWPSSSSRPSSILTFLYPAATNWLNSAARQS